VTENSAARRFFFDRGGSDKDTGFPPPIKAFEVRLFAGMTNLGIGRHA
jgi:hypothetical protein